MVGPDGALPLPWLGAWLDGVRGRSAHALLLHGPEGVGQRELALTLAQAWLCESDGDAARRPCGRCASCRLVQARAHPDLHVLLPEALREPLGWVAESEADGAADRETKKQPSKEIKVDAVRAAVEFAQTTSARGRTKVLLIHPAERMNGIAANALLKTLEEPPGTARFVLSCGAPDALLPTIRSRCQAIALHVPDAAVATAWLSSRGVARPEVMLAAAGGQPLQALAWVEQGIDAAAWMRLPKSVGRGDPGGLVGWPLPRAVEALQKLCHDALCRAVGAPARYFADDALPAAGRVEALLEWSRELSRVARVVEHPWNAGLTLEALVTQGHKALLPVDNARPAPKNPSVNSRA